MYRQKHNHINTMVVLCEFSECVTKSDAYFGEAESNSFTFDKLLTTAGVIYPERDVCSVSILIKYVTNHENPSPATNRSPDDSKIHPTIAFTARRNRL